MDVLGFVNEVGACLAAVERLTTRVSETRVAGQRGADGPERAGQRHGVHHGRGLILRLLGAGGLVSRSRIRSAYCTPTSKNARG